MRGMKSIASAGVSLRCSSSSMSTSGPSASRTRRTVSAARLMWLTCGAKKGSSSRSSRKGLMWPTALKPASFRATQFSTSSSVVLP